jgi:hypothetical protein
MIDKLKQLLTPDVDIAAKVAVVTLFIGKMFEKHEARIESLEARQLQKGDKGDKGDSVSVSDVLPELKKLHEKALSDEMMQIPAYISATVSDAVKGIKQPKDGKPGKDGVSVSDAEVDLNGHLLLNLSDGKFIDAGKLPETQNKSAVHVAGNAYQITVSATAPSSPQLNQLWLDIS